MHGGDRPRMFYLITARLQGSLQVSHGAHAATLKRRPRSLTCRLRTFRSRVAPIDFHELGMFLAAFL